MIVAVASPRVAKSVDEALEKIRGLTSKAAGLGADVVCFPEKAMMCRALENAIYFASVNYGFRHQESATSLIGPTGDCLAHLPCGQEGVLAQDIDPRAATGVFAERYAPERCVERPEPGMA